MSNLLLKTSTATGETIRIINKAVKRKGGDGHNRATPAKPIPATHSISGRDFIAELWMGRNNASIEMNRSLGFG